MDDELIRDANIFDYGASDAFSDMIKWLVININKSIDDQKKELLLKRPGAIFSSAEPRLVWTTMLRRPNNTTRKEVYTLTKKFNSTLEEVISKDKKSHILKVHIDGSEKNFEPNGDLTSYGHVQFWRGINEEMKDFDYGKTDLIPNSNIETEQFTPKQSNFAKPHTHRFNNRFK